jgi:hypothetical protein
MLKLLNITSKFFSIAMYVSVDSQTVCHAEFYVCLQFVSIPNVIGSLITTIKPNVKYKCYVVTIYIVTRLVTVDGVLDCQLDLLGSNTQLHTITAESLRTLPITNSSAENPLNSFVPFLLSWPPTH